MQALRHAADKATENLGRKDGATSGIGDKGTDAVLNGYTVGRVKQVTAPSAGHLSDIACGRGAAANGWGGHPQIVLNAAVLARAHIPRSNHNLRSSILTREQLCIV